MNSLFKVVANDSDITAILKDRLLRLSIHDGSGETSDTVTIDLDNRDQAIQFPATGAALDVYIGLGDSLVFKGTYEVDELTEQLENDTLTIHGKAAKMKSSLKAPRNATFDDITLGELLTRIAASHNYQPAISDDLAAVQYAHIDQVGESDINLLTRLARDQGAIAKPVADRLVMVAKGESKTVSGNDLPLIIIDDPENSTGTVTIQERNDYQSVTAQYFDEELQKNVPVTIGSGDPCYTCRKAYVGEAAAQAAANAKLAELKRGTATLSITRPLTPDLVPEGQIEVIGHKASANGTWLINSVEHVIEAGSVAYSAMSCTVS